MASSKEILAKLSADHYHWLIHQVPSRQDNLFRTYLWLASLALTIAVYFFKDAPKRRKRHEQPPVWDM